jgi:hypothetical protein
MVLAEAMQYQVLTRDTRLDRSSSHDLEVHVR